MSQPDPDATPAAVTTPAAPGERRAFVLAAIAAAFVLFLLAEGILYWRWATVNEPTCVLIVEASAALRGAEVTVDSPGLTTPHKVTIGAGGRYAIPFYVQHGTYSVEVKLGDTEVYRSEVALTPVARGRKLDLTQVRPPATAPASPASAGTATY